jgi:uncharacterized protein YdcH (DUF465 family)
MSIAEAARNAVQTSIQEERNHAVMKAVDKYMVEISQRLTQDEATAFRAGFIYGANDTHAKAVEDVKSMYKVAESRIESKNMEIERLKKEIFRMKNELEIYAKKRISE